MVITANPKIAAYKILFALVLGSVSSAVWVYFADVYYHNHVAAEDFVFYSLYPLGIGLSAIITTLIFDRSLKPIGFKIPPLKFIGNAIILATVLTLVPFILNQVFSLTGINKSPEIYGQLLLYGLPALAILAFGEELMWRGLLFPGFSEFMGFTPASIVTGLIWSAWHYPIIIHTKLLYTDKSAIESLTMFTALVTFSAFIYNYLRKVSRSIWPCVVLHTLVNFYLYIIVAPIEAPVYPWSKFFMNDIGMLYVLAALTGALHYGGGAKK